MNVTEIEKARRRDDLVDAYSRELYLMNRGEGYLLPEGWKRVNQAIIDKWSVNALEYIKKRAWERLRTP